MVMKGHEKAGSGERDVTCWRSEGPGAEPRSERGGIGMGVRGAGGGWGSRSPPRGCARRRRGSPALAGS